jgi:hypothetical protein
MYGRGSDVPASNRLGVLEAAHAARAEGQRRPGDWALQGLLAFLDLSVVVTGAAVLLYLTVGRIDLQLFSISGFAKPFLQFFVLASVRTAVPRSSWLPTLIAGVVDSSRSACRRWAEGNDWVAAGGDAALALLSTRIVTKAVSFATNLAYHEFIPRSFEPPFRSVAFAETFAAWDSAWYLDIAQRGYVFRDDAQSSVAFFPLYPLLIRAVASLFGGSERAFWVSAILLSYASFFAALVLLHRLTDRLLQDRDAARRAVLYAAVFPFSFPFTQIYTESLFLLLSVASVWCAGAGRWPLAGLCGALATVTRPNGIVLAVPLVIMALQAPWTWAALARRALPLLALPGALALYCLFVYRLSGDPLAWLNAQAHWGYSIGNPPWATIQRTLESVEALGLYGHLVRSEDALYGASHALIGLAVIALTPSVFRRLGVAMGCYVALGILIPFTGNALEGVGRYAATLFPLFIYLGAAIRGRRVHEAVLIGSALWLALNIGFFVTQRPVY